MMKRLYEWIVIDKMEKDKRPEFVYDVVEGYVATAGLK